jgi:hypothetical protein
MQELKFAILTRGIHLASTFAVVFLASLIAAGVVSSSILESGWIVALIVMATFGAARLAFDKHTWLPFLGPTILPPSALSLKTPAQSSLSTTVNAPSNVSHVMYWAANTGSGIVDDPMDAYGNFANAGVVTATDGRATLQLQCPGQYRVRGRVLPRHVHYRFVRTDGIVSGIMTKKLVCM